MKWICTLWMPFFILLAMVKTGAQSPGNTQYYTFEKDSGAYTTFDTAKMMSISGGDVWVEDDVYKVPLPFPFRFLNQNLTYIKTNQTNLFLPERNYYLAVFGNFLMYDHGNDVPNDTVGLSPISYLVDSSSGSKIMKIQFLHAGFFFDSSMYLNVQIWLYEKTNTLEIHYGKSHINLSKSQVIGCGPLVGLAKVDTVGGLEQYEFDLRGNATDPSTVTLQGSGKRCLNNVPTEGTIYRFLFHDSAKTEIIYPGKYAIYPNPTHGLLHIDLTGPSAANIEVVDMVGNAVLSKTVYYGDELNINHLRNGIYMVKIRQGNDYYMQKILLTR